MTPSYAQTAIATTASRMSSCLLSPHLFLLRSHSRLHAELPSILLMQDISELPSILLMQAI